MNIQATIESILFFKGEPMLKKELASILNVSKSEIETALRELEILLTNRGIVLVENGEEITLSTSKESSEIIQKLMKEELERDLSKASLETLPIILYRGPIARSQIDYVRGVNSQFILRNLAIRGLIERIENPNDQRSFLYIPSLLLLQHLGVSKVSELPEYEKVITEFEKAVVKEKMEEREEQTTTTPYV